MNETDKEYINRIYNIEIKMIIDELNHFNIVNYIIKNKNIYTDNVILSNFSKFVHNYSYNNMYIDDIISTHKDYILFVISNLKKI